MPHAREPAIGFYYLAPIPGIGGQATQRSVDIVLIHTYLLRAKTQGQLVMLTSMHLYSTLAAPEL